MPTWQAMAVILPLGLDSLAMAAAVGAAGVPAEARRRVALLFTAVEAGMPVIGLILGAPLGRAVGAVADYLAVVALSCCGVWMLLEDDDEDTERIGRLSRTRGLVAVALALTIGLDELAVGFSLGLLELPLLPLVLALAVQAFVFAQVGLQLGARLGARLREAAERSAGMALIALSVALLVQLLLAR